MLVVVLHYLGCYYSFIYKDTFTKILLKSYFNDEMVAPILQSWYYCLRYDSQQLVTWQLVAQQLVTWQLVAQQLVTWQLVAWQLVSIRILVVIVDMIR